MDNHEPISPDITAVELQRAADSLLRYVPQTSDQLELTPADLEFLKGIRIKP
jgi:hypothetical protein